VEQPFTNTSCKLSGHCCCVRKRRVESSSICSFALFSISRKIINHTTLPWYTYTPRCDARLWEMSWLQLFLLRWALIGSVTPLFSPSHASFPSKSPSNSFLCSNFFTVLSEIQPFRTGGLEPCADTFVRMDYLFRSLSSQMISMNSTLTIFTTYSPSQKHCHLDPSYRNLRLVYFDIFDLFSEFSLLHVVPIFENFYYDDYAKISDILRILFARKYSMAYIDLDIHFLNEELSLYQQEFLAMHVWNPTQCSLEITNAAFCLSPEHLLRVQTAMVTQILSGNIYRYHTELGPTLFAKTLSNLPVPIFFYTLNHPETFHLTDMISEIHRYRHHLLHLTSSLRQLLHSSQTLTYEIYINQLRALLQLPPLQLPPSVLTSESYYYALQAMVTNHPTYPNQLSLSLQLAEMSVTRHIGQCLEEKHLEATVEESYYESVEILNRLLLMTTDSSHEDSGSGSEDLERSHQLAKELIQRLDEQTCTSLGTED
jgi:hypothetical protein